MKASLPANEAARLETLQRYAVLDTPPEQAFDDLTLLAAQICQMPMATVSLVDDKRQWFKSRIGMAAQETPRDIAFCAHTILHADEIMEIRDAQTDVRFADNPLVTGDPNIRFYAGAPLVAPDGQSLGALCVMDHKPRALTAEQQAALKALSRHVVTQLELRRQARDLAAEVVERQRAEASLRVQFEQLTESKQEASRLLLVAEKSRRALLGVLEDEKLSGQKLRDSEERFRQLAENINEVFWMTDPAMNLMLYISRAYETIWGRTCESLYANPETWIESIHPEDRTRMLGTATTRQVMGDYDETYRIVRPDGTERWIHDRAYPVRNETGKVYRMVGTAEDITGRMQAELRTSVQHAVTAALSEAAPLPETVQRILQIICERLKREVGVFWVRDRATKTLRCVESWHATPKFQPFAEASRKMTFAAADGLPGRVWSTKEPLWIADVTHENFFRRQPQAAELGLRGAIAFPVKLQDEVFGVVEFFTTESQPPDGAMLSMFVALGTQIGQFMERKQLEDQFRQAQKMEAIGTLAGGIAHDFNNVLGAITGYTDLARMESRDRPEVLEYLEAVSKASRRAADLVRQILAFSRQQEQQRKSMQLWPIVEEALNLLRATIPSTIRFETSVAGGGPTVMADPTQIHQVIMNLVTNAAHAMKDRPGRLGVILENVGVDDDLAAQHPGLRPGSYMRLGVSDTGHGMDAATLSRIFDPFFTTKGPGEGTGLGLAVVHGIMQSNDGVITVYSQVGEGTQFHLYFPAEGGPESTVVVQSAETPRGRGERILVVDDEMPLALMGKKILDRLGYQADTQTVPIEALNAVRADPGKYHLVITDLTMPGLNGTDLAEHLLKIRPDLPIVLTTGYTATLTPERLQAMKIRQMLMKPLSAEALGNAVFSVLHPPQSN